MLPTTQFAYQNGLATCDALFCVSDTLQNSLESGLEARILEINFTAVFDRDNLNHQSILTWPCSAGIGGSGCLYRHSFRQTDHSTLWWMVVGVNWLTLCQVCCRAVFWARYCSACTLQSFFLFCKISVSVNYAVCYANRHHYKLWHHYKHHYKLPKQGVALATISWRITRIIGEHKLQGITIKRQNSTNGYSTLYEIYASTGGDQEQVTI